MTDNEITKGLEKLSQIKKAMVIKKFSHFLVNKAEHGIINISDLPDLVAEFIETEVEK